jgi:hypothetical protein
MNVEWLGWLLALSDFNPNGVLLTGFGSFTNTREKQQMKT